MNNNLPSIEIEFRFPEFSKENWKSYKLFEIANYENGRAHEQDIDINGKYVVVNSKYISSDGEVAKYSNIANCLANENDILMVLSDVPNGKAIAKCFLVKESNKFTVNQRICKITPSDKVNSVLLFYLMNRNTYFLSFDDGVKQTNLKNDDVLNFELLIPSNPKEQQKIADCLSSLDEVITLHEEKLVALEEHKKGLMQNLFPQEGETVPKYRFPKFKNDGDWIEKSLQSITDKIMVGIASSATHAYRKKGIVLLRNQNIKNGYLDDNEILYLDEEYEKSHKNKRLKEGDLLTARTGYPGSTCVVPSKYNGAQSFTTLISRPKLKIVNSYFLSYYINSEKGQHFFETKQAGGGQKNVNAGILINMQIPLPKSIKEQQKIAECLSSIDELIIHQHLKIEKLKEHKKGLMQGLFPKVDN